MAQADFTRMKNVLILKINEMETAAYTDQTISEQAAENLLEKTARQFLREYNEFLTVISLGVSTVR